MLLALETPQSRMARMATQSLQGEAYRPVSAVLAEIAAVSRDDVLALSREFFDPERQLVVRLGPEQ